MPGQRVQYKHIPNTKYSCYELYLVEAKLPPKYYGLCNFIQSLILLKTSPHLI